MTTLRRGGMIKVLMILVVVGSLGAFTWVTIANSHRTGSLDCRPLEADWWTLTTPAAPTTPTTLVQDAKALAAKAEDRLWGNGGLIERCEGWWQSHLAKHIETVAGTNPSPDRLRYEQQFADADAAFRSGLDAYKRASPNARGSADDKKAAAKEARIHFQHTSDMLIGSIGPYEALADHDPNRAHAAHQLLAYDNELLDLVGPR